MHISLSRVSKLWIAGLALAGMGSLAGCVSDDADSDGDAGSAGSGGSTAGTGGSSGGSGGSTAGTGGKAAGGSAGSAGSAGSGGSPPVGAKCTAPIVVGAATPGITDFESYDGAADLTMWSFALGDDTATGVFAGTFGYGDETTGFPEAFEMVTGNDSTYALGISDTLAEEYGGGLGLWISECLDATAFSGISFWVRGNSPTGDAKLSLLMSDTTSSTATTPDDAIGTCEGTDMECIHPTFVFPVTDTWTQVEVAWSQFVPGNANGTMVVPDGSNVWQIQYDVGLVWLPDDAGVYMPTPAEYEFAVDDLTFY